MIKTHLTVEGGEQWLSWAYGRERALRALGVPYMTKRWDMGDGSTVTVRITPDTSYIELRGGAWAAYPFDLVLQTSKVNKWNKVTFGTPMPPDPGPQPTPPINQPYPTRPTVPSITVTFPPPPDCPVQPLPESVYPVHNQGCTSSWVDDTYRDITNTNRTAAAQARWDAQLSASQAGFPFVSSPPPPRPPNNAFAGEAQTSFAGIPTGNTGGFSYSLVGWTPFQDDLGGGWYILNYHNELYISGYSAGADPMVQYWSEMGSWGAACKSISDANGAANGAYQTALAAWQVAYNKWLAAQNGHLEDPSVCYPAFGNSRSSSAATRARQIADLKDEVLIGGMNSLCVFNAVARPAYAPVAFPAEPFVVARTVDEQLVWAEPRRYVDAPFTISNTTLADSSSCSGTSPAYAYAGVHVDRRPLDDRPKVTTRRAHGFSVTGTYYSEEHGMPEATDPKGIIFTPSYADWMKSRKAVFDRATYLRLADLSIVGFDPAAKAWMDASTTPPTGIVGRPVDFDLTYGRTNKVRVMHFEFRVYDPFTSQWQWVAAKSLTGVNTVSECITGGCKNAARPPSGGVAPPTDGRFVSHMRFLAAKEHRFASTSDGAGTEWVANTELDVDGTSKFNINLSAYSFNADTLPDGVAVMYGLSNQELPAVPSCAQGTTKQHLDSLAIPDLSSTAVNFVALKEWIVKTATNALTKATPKPTN